MKITLEQHKEICNRLNGTIKEFIDPHKIGCDPTSSNPIKVEMVEKYQTAYNNECSAIQSEPFVEISGLDFSPP